jgi:hypothetical protein
MRVEIHQAARKHVVSDEDITHAYEHVLAWVEGGEDPTPYLVAGPDRAGNLLELVIVVTQTVELVIHAMKIRPPSQAQLFGGEER